MRKFSFLGIITFFIFMSAIPLHADDTVLFTSNVSPDALIALDLSGSMMDYPGGSKNCQDNSGCRQPFGIATTQPNDTCSDSTYQYRCDSRYLSGGTWVYYKWSDPTCSGPFYNSSGSGHSTDCSKLAIAKRTIFNLLDANGDGQLRKEDEDALNIRVGYMRFYNIVKEDSSLNYSTGDNILRRGFDFDYSGLYDTYIKNESAQAATGLVLQMKEAKQYLDAHKATDPAAECRKKFIILISDGGDNLSCGGDHTDANGDGVPDRTELQTRSFGYMHRKATVAAVKDIVDAGYQVFAVGFGANMSTSERRTLEWVAYYGGTFDPLKTQTVDPTKITMDPNPCWEDPSCSLPTDAQQIDCWWSPNDPGGPNGRYASGYAFIAQDATALATALKNIFKYIKEKSLTFTAPTVPSVRLTDTENVYISSFTPNATPFWKGDLKAYALNADGTLPVDDNGYPSQSPLWEASPLLGSANPDDRKIYTAKSGSRVDFKSGSLTFGDLGVTNNTERDEVINHVRGYDPWDTDKDGSTTDTRTFKLGDIFHSQAAIVGAPSTFFTDIGYSGTGGFYDTKKNRTKVILAGANDGMLHAFDAATGAEKWGFIPPALLTSLKAMKTTATHLYYVDGSPRVSDVWFYSSSTDTSKSVDEWRTVLINGLRKGGTTYFALDITDTLDPVYLWEFPKSTDAATLAVVGQSWSDPTIGRVKIEGADGELQERWVAFIGGGWDANYKVWEAADRKGRAFYVVDIKTGDILWQYKYNAADSGEKGKMKHSLAAPAMAVDTNTDGYVDRVYIGDLGGQMWVFNLSFNALTKKSDSLWSGKRLFQAPGAHNQVRNIYYQPAVAFDQSGVPWVFFGTGDRESPIEGGAERFYAVKDDGLGVYPRLEANLENLIALGKNTFVSPVDPMKGWFLTLTSAAKEQSLSRPVVFNNLVYFTTFTPRETVDACSVGAGTAKLYVLHYLSGGGALEVDEMSDLSGSSGLTRSKIIGSGLPSSPAITINTQGQATVIVGTTESQVYSTRAFSPINMKQMLYWREVLN